MQQQHGRWCGAGVHMSKSASLPLSIVSADVEGEEGWWGVTTDTQAAGSDLKRATGPHITSSRFRHGKGGKSRGMPSPHVRCGRSESQLFMHMQC